MSGISTGTGLISGLDIQGLIDQLIAVEARPRQLVEQRKAVLQSQKTAFLDINSRVLGLESAAQKLGDASTFKAKQVSSSASSVLTASASNSAAVGSYSFTVDRLVSTHQLISRGFADTDTTKVGAGTLTFESGAARLTSDAKLAHLNGGEGIERGTIRITDRSGSTADVDLSRAVSLDEVVSAINGASGINVTASLDGDNLKLTDNTGSTTQDLVVADLSGRTTAADLGIAGNSSGTNEITGTQINTLGSLSQLAALNDGNGIRTTGTTLADFSIDLGGSSFDVNLAEAGTIGDVVDAINDHTDNPGVTAAVAADGVSLELTAAGNITVTALNSSKAAADLGIEGSATNTLSGTRLVSKLGSRLLNNLNGGSGITTPGTIDITSRDGNTTTVDLSAASSVSDVIDTINAAGAGVTASLNDAGNGIKLTDTTGSTASNLTVADNSGTSAADLGIAGDVDADAISGSNVNFQYITENTRLDALNQGEGITAGKFTLTDSAGVTAEVDLTQGETTLKQVIAEINSRPTSITATINDTGDGIKLTDTAGGSVKMSVEESGSTTAADLGILGEDEDDDGVITGSFEKTVAIEADDTLDDVVTKINEAGVNASASIINDGSGVNGYRLNLTSRNSGAKGEILFDDGGLDFGASTLVKGRDAKVLYGSPDASQALVLTSSTNTLSDTINGVTIDLKGVSDEPVTVSVTPNNGSIVKAVESFVSSFNNTLDTLDKYDNYDQETEEKSLLLGDPTISQSRSRLFNSVLGKVEGIEGRYQFLSQIGLRIGEGARMAFDAEKFNAALAEDATAVRELFTATTSETTTQVELPDGVTTPNNTSDLREVGFGKVFRKLTQSLTNSIDGLITNKTNAIDTKVEQADDRIEQLNKLLQSKRARLEQQFLSMEKALASLQDQQAALAGLAGRSSGLSSLANL